MTLGSCVGDKETLEKAVRSARTFTLIILELISDGEPFSGLTTF